MSITRIITEEVDHYEDRKIHTEINLKISIINKISRVNPSPVRYDLVISINFTVNIIQEGILQDLRNENKETQEGNYL